MPFNKSLRVEQRTVSAGVMFTGDEIRSIREQNPDTDAKDSLVDIVQTAQVAGREACKIAGCELRCVVIDLSDTVSQYDADLTARCQLTTCDDTGVAVALRAIESVISE